MSEQRIVFFDFETGGVEPHHPDIQVAAIAVTAWPEFAHVESFERKIAFDRDAAQDEALDLNSYDPDVWEREAVPPRQVRAELSAFLNRHATVQRFGKRPPHRQYWVAALAGHNAASFDGPRLHRFFRGAFVPAEWYRPLDTLQLAAWYFARNGAAKDAPPNYQLGTLCEAFGIETPNAHDALGDVKATIELAAVILGAWA